MLQGPPFLTDKQHGYGDGVSVNPLKEAVIRVTKTRAVYHLRHGQRVMHLEWCFGLVMPSVDHADSHFVAEKSMYSFDRMGYYNQTRPLAGASTSLAWYFNLLLHKPKRKRKVSSR